MFWEGDTEAEKDGRGSRSGSAKELQTLFPYSCFQCATGSLVYCLSGGAGCERACGADCAGGSGCGFPRCFGENRGACRSLRASESCAVSRQGDGRWAALCLPWLDVGDRRALRKYSSRVRRRLLCDTGEILRSCRTTRICLGMDACGKWRGIECGACRFSWDGGNRLAALSDGT